MTDLKHSKHLSLAIPPLLLTIATLLGVLLAMRWGIGVTPDTLTYFDIVRSIGGVEGFPPGYSIMLIPFHWLGFELTTAAKILNIALLVLTTLMYWWILHAATASPRASFLGAYLILSSPLLLEQYAHALSEPPFIFWSFLALFALSRYVETEKLSFLFGTAFAAAFSMLTRFAGAALLPVAIITITFMGRSPRKKRLLSSTFTAVTSCIPIGSWMIYNKILYGAAATGRAFAFRGNPDVERFTQGASALTRFILPTFIPLWFRVIACGTLLVSLITLMVTYARQTWKNIRQDGGHDNFGMLPYVLSGYIICYAGLLIFAVFVQADLPLYERFWPPVYVAVALLAFLTVHKTIFSKGQTRKVVAVAVVVVGVGLALLNTARTIKWTALHYEVGIDFSSKSWQTSKVIERVRSLDLSIPVYSNNPWALTFLTGREVVLIPTKFELRTRYENKEYAIELEKMRTDIVGRGGVLIYFWTDYKSERFPSLNELKNYIPLEADFVAGDGGIYRCKSGM